MFSISSSNITLFRFVFLSAIALVFSLLLITGTFHKHDSKSLSIVELIKLDLKVLYSSILLIVFVFFFEDDDID